MSNTLVFEADLFFLDHFPGAPDVADVCHHWQHNVEPSFRRGPKDRAHLSAHNLLVGQPEAYTPQAKRRVSFRLSNEVACIFAAEVKETNNRAVVTGQFRNLGISGVLLVL